MADRRSQQMPVVLGDSAGPADDENAPSHNNTSGDSARSLSDTVECSLISDVTVNLLTSRSVATEIDGAMRMTTGVRCDARVAACKCVEDSQ
jgi:hypothetical protein